MQSSTFSGGKIPHGLDRFGKRIGQYIRSLHVNCILARDRHIGTHVLLSA
jgi:hypothetical protein